ncbi:unnamed protein product [Parascedosporium putredinis]|uniref:Ankyrin repeat protein n=1 Tax=Parascedosporium putredinis TaxID=1442378 RepID=A0A9P1M9P9_9PEZI|nr:unnamed protein product [Parascedosporium putredinis]CAI7992470.1 unnamed protein product [Parascedosporium putredinis]
MDFPPSTWMGVSPTSYAFLGSYDDVYGGEGLLRELAPLMYSHPLFTPDEVFSILRNGMESARAEPDLVNLYVTLCNPKDHGTAKHIRAITHGAACYRGAEYLKLLLRHGAHDFFGMDPKQHTPKFKGAMLDEPWDDYFGYTEMSTALHFAVSKGNVEAVEFLLAQPGGEVQWRDGYGRTAYDYGKHRKMLIVEGRTQRPIPGLDQVLKCLSSTVGRRRRQRKSRRQSVRNQTQKIEASD